MTAKQWFGRLDVIHYEAPEVCRIAQQSHQWRKACTDLTLDRR